MKFPAHQFSCDLTCHTVHGEVPCHFISPFDHLHFRAAKLDGWKLLRIKIIRLSQMLVPRGIRGVNTVSLDGQAETEFRRILTIN